MKIKKLNEDKNIPEADPRVVKEVAREIDADVVDVAEEGYGVIEKELDAALREAESMKARRKHNKKKKVTWPNILFSGGAGVGKTARIDAWAEKNGLTLVSYSASTLDKLDVGGMQVRGKVIDDETGEEVEGAIRLNPLEFNKLNHDYVVLFLDELNRAKKDVRGTLLTLINNHLVLDQKSDTNFKELDFLFTVSAINPSQNGEYGGEPLDQAEMTRFQNIRVAPELKVVYSYLLRTLQGDLDETEDVIKDCLASDNPRDQRRVKILQSDLVEIPLKINLLKYLFDNNAIDLDDDGDAYHAEELRNNRDWNGLLTSSRTLTMLFNRINGTKADLIEHWNEFCNNLQYDDIVLALNNYTDPTAKVEKEAQADVDDIANSVFAQKKKSNSERAKEWLNKNMS